ncbi:MAG: PVC-type heme-binding CxxCH protein [Pirellulaceae bacterium]
MHYFPAIIICLFGQVGAESLDTVATIESTRGGRHWVEQKTPPSRSPQESLKAIVVEPGYRVELVAAEPIVMDPVAIAFDVAGRMFVVEYGDYPIGPDDPDAPPLSRIVLLEDTDGDGRMDRRNVFAEHLKFAHSLMPYRDGLLVGAQTELLFLKDTTGDNKADIRETLYSGFVPAHPQMQIGNPRWGLDNWIYCNYAVGEITGSQTGEKLTVPRGEFKFNPQTGEFGPASGVGQYGNTIDRWGRRFFATNRNPVMTERLPWEVAKRNPHYLLPTTHYDVAPSGGSSLVFPLIEMKSNYLSHSGTHTAACGVTAYLGPLGDTDYQNSVFVCEPIGHLVTRTIVKNQGAKLTSERARAKADFFVSTDPWFRPSSLATGPDGGLYLADMYRLWVEHPKFLPEEVAAKLDWRAGDDLGRIWRIVPEGDTLEPYTPPSEPSDLVRQLQSTSPWQRFTAQQLIVEDQLTSLAVPLREILTSHDQPGPRLHALWTLDGLDQLTIKDVQTALADEAPQVRADAVRLTAQFMDDRPGLAQEVSLLGGDSDASVRLQVAIVLGTLSTPESRETRLRIALQDYNDEIISKALLTSTVGHGELAEALLRRPQFADRTSDRRATDFVRELATIVGTAGEVSELAQLLSLFEQVPAIDWRWHGVLIEGLATGLERHRGDLGRTSLAKLLSDPPASLAKFTPPVQTVLDQASDRALNAGLPLGQREAAIPLLRHQAFTEMKEVYATLLDLQQSEAIQRAIIDTMLRHDLIAGSQIALEGWQEIRPKVQGEALTRMLRHDEATADVLSAMEKGEVSPAQVGLEDRLRLLRHRTAEVRELASKLFGGAVSADREKVVRDYQAALSGSGSVESGKKIFAQSCGKCHRLDGEGFEVGPDLSDARNRSKDALMFDILDPSRKVDPQYTEYLVATDDGRTISGLLVSEDDLGLVLKQPEGKQETVPRDRIEAMKASPKSLMPEGVEKEINVQQMVDLLEYLTSPR